MSTLSSPPPAWSSQPPGAPAHPGRSSWSDAAARASLLLLADSLRHNVGFGVAVLSVVDDQGLAENVAVAGSDAVGSALLGRRVPLTSLLELREEGRHSGATSLVAPPRPRSGDDWHPDDWLSVAVHDPAGDVVGLVQLDEPVDGRRPTASQLLEIDRKCDGTKQAIVALRDHEQLAAQARLALTARNVLRTTSGRQSIASILARCHPAVLEGFRARALFIQLLDEQGRSRTGTVYTADGRELEVPVAVLDIAERDAHKGWTEQRGAILDEHHGPLSDWLDQSEADDLLPFLEGLGVDSLIFAPVGVGSTCLGSITLTRNQGDPAWSEAELEAALDVGHDLGQAVLNARAWRHEQELLEELRALDTYKSRLIATVSHELRNPLSAVAGHLEILGSMLDQLPRDSERSLAAMTRGSRRLERIIEDLLLFSTVGDPQRAFAPAEVDLAQVVREVRDLLDLGAQRRDQHVEVDVPDEPVLVQGVTEDLDCVVSNLVGNALKYSSDGSTVRVRLHQDEREVSLECVDEGVGIAPEDQDAVFAEFYRSADPAVRRQGGTGLGLAIVCRIVQRHRGRIAVDSEVGAGSTFTVVLPVLAEAERIAAREAGDPEQQEPGTTP